MTAGPLTVPARATRTLWLVRHGESEWNALGLCQGQMPAPGLTARGRRQAERCAQAMAGEPVGILLTSDLARAQETAAPIARALGIEVVTDLRLRERSLGDAEGLPSALLGPDRSGLDGRRVVDADAAPSGGESVRQLYERVVGCVSERLGDGPGDLALVCHGGVVRVLRAWLAGKSPDTMEWPKVRNGLPTRVVVGAPTPAAP